MKGSVQAVMAMDTLLNALVKQRYVPIGAAAGIRATINRAYAAVEDPNGLSAGRLPRRAQAGGGRDREASLMRVRRWVMLMTSIALAACSGGTPQGGGSYTTIGGSAGSGSGGSGAGGSDSGGSGGAFYADPAAESLSIADVQAVIARAAAQAQADGKPAVIAVVDRVGNVLALYRMTGAPANAHISDAPNGQNIDVQGARRARRCRRARQGDHRSLSLQRRQCLFLAHGRA